MDQIVGGGGYNNNEYHIKSKHNGKERGERVGAAVDVGVDKNCCILKGALCGRGMGYPPPHYLMGKLLLQDVPPPLKMNNIPYNKDELRQKVFEKYLPRAKPKYFSVNDEEQVREAFADFVINVPILVDGHRVSRKAWAKAFYETDTINSAKCLFEALFSEKEMQQCTLNGKNRTMELSAVKMLAILRASCWMKNKSQDPYFFNAGIESHNQHPSKEEQEKIEKKVFTERRSQANRKNNKRKFGNGTKEAINGFEADSDSQNGDLDNNNKFDREDSEGSPSSECMSPTSSQINFSPMSTPVTSPQTFEFGELEELFYRHPDEFVDILIPNWMDRFIFIDGLLVDKEKWGKAFEEGGEPVKAAWILFLALFSEDEITKCTLNGKNGTVELCPVKKLAIIRAVEWMRLNTGILEKSCYWDNDDEICNVFPSKEDKERIETKVFTEKRYQQSRHLNLHKVPLMGD